MFDEPANVRPATERDVRMIHNAAGPLGGLVMLDHLDERYIECRPAQNTNIMWSREGHRITVSFKDGSLVMARSKDVDPYYPGKEAAR